MKNVFAIVFGVFYKIFSIFFFVFLALSIYISGFKLGEIFGFMKAKEEILSLTKKQVVDDSQSYKEIPKITPTPLPVKTSVAKPKIPDWTGPELWEAVNKARVENGVNPLKQADELCTIASIRLNELLELGKLDGHEGFSNLPERRPDLKWIFEKYNISEFLIVGAVSPQDAVSSWFNTLGHKKLLTGGEYVWGCTYAQNSFGVAIAAYQ